MMKILQMLQIHQSINKEYSDSPTAKKKSTFLHKLNVHEMKFLKKSLFLVRASRYANGTHRKATRGACFVMTIRTSMGMYSRVLCYGNCITAADEILKLNQQQLNGDINSSHFSTSAQQPIVSQLHIRDDIIQDDDADCLSSIYQKGYRNRNVGFKLSDTDNFCHIILKLVPDNLRHTVSIVSVISFEVGQPMSRETISSYPIATDEIASVLNRSLNIVQRERRLVNFQDMIGRHTDPEHGQHMLNCIPNFPNFNECLRLLRKPEIATRKQHVLSELMFYGMKIGVMNMNSEAYLLDMTKAYVEGTDPKEAATVSETHPHTSVITVTSPGSFYNSGFECEQANRQRESDKCPSDSIDDMYKRLQFAAARCDEGECIVEQLIHDNAPSQIALRHNSILLDNSSMDSVPPHATIARVVRNISSDSGEKAQTPRTYT